MTSKLEQRRKLPDLHHINADIAKLDIREVGGLYRANDIKIIFDWLVETSTSQG